MNERCFPSAGGYAPGAKENPASGAGSEETKIGAQSINADDRQPLSASQAAKSVDAAIALSKAGRSAIPVHCTGPHAKRPAIKTWESYQRTHTDRPLIESMFKRHPDAGVAHIMGNGLFVLDIDCKNGTSGFESLQRLELEHGALPHTFTVTTPSGGRHYYFRVPEGVRTRCGNGLFPGIDVKGDGGYVVAPPTMLDAGAYVADNDAPYCQAPAWLLALVRADRERPAQGSIPSGGPALVGRQVLADLAGALHFHDPGDYDSWIKAGMALRELGDDGFSLWVEFSSRSPKFTIEEAREKWATFQPVDTGYPSIFKTAQSNGWRNPAGKGAAFAPPVEDDGPDGGFIWGDVLTSPEHLKAAEWLVRSIIPAECTGLLVGRWGTCKTFVALDFAGCIASGKDWHGHATRQGTVFYLCGEGESGIARRLRAWEIGNGGSVAGIAVRQMPDIRDAETLARMMDTIDRLAVSRGQPRLILIDTLFTALNGGNENSGQDMGEVFRAMRALRQRFRCAVIAVHHTGHDEERARGHSSMEAGVDVQLFLGSDQRAGSTILTLANRKQKDGAPFEPITLTTEDVKLVGLTDDLGQVESSLVIRRAGDAKMAEHEAMLADMRLEGSKLPGDRKRREEMIQFAVDMWPEIQNLQAICDLIYEKYGHKKHPPRVKDWLNKRGIDTSRRT